MTHRPAAEPESGPARRQPSGCVLAVLMLAAARDRRVRGVVSAFGPTDFFLPGAGSLAGSVLFALRDGRLPAVQMHHGARDPKVPAAHSERLGAALRALGRAPEVFVYAEGRRASRSLAGHRARAEAFLQRTVALAR